MNETRRIKPKLTYTSLAKICDLYSPGWVCIRSTKKSKKLRSSKICFFFLKTINFKMIFIRQQQIKKFIYIFIGSNCHLSLSSVPHTTTKRTHIGKTKNFNSTLRENGIESVKPNISLRALKLLNCAKFQIQWDLPLMFCLKRKQKSFKMYKYIKIILLNLVAK